MDNDEPNDMISPTRAGRIESDVMKRVTHYKALVAPVYSLPYYEAVLKSGQKIVLRTTIYRFDADDCARMIHKSAQTCPVDSDDRSYSSSSGIPQPDHQPPPASSSKTAHSCGVSSMIALIPRADGALFPARLCGPC